MLEHGTIALHVIERGERLGVRIKDSAAKTRTEFAGIERWPADPALRVQATLTPHATPTTIEITPAHAPAAAPAGEGAVMR